VGIGLIAVLALPAWADVKLPAVIGDHMVLQQGMNVPIWGTAEAGEEVTVSIDGQKKTAKAETNGKWMVRLDLLKASDKPLEMTVAGKNSLTVSDILVGEVWLCSGQSNMEMSVRSSRAADKEIAAAKYPQMRLFQVKKAATVEPAKDVEAKWAACSPETVPNFSAAGYFFGRDLLKDLKVPVGLVHSSWGGTPAEAWMDLPVLKAEPDFQAIVERYDATAADKPTHFQRPTVLYNGMIVPLAPFAIHGVIWYQGEANAGRAYQYRKLLPAMIKNWRDLWGQDFSFLIVSLANFQPSQDQPAESAWAELREAQAMTAAQKNNGLAVIIDVGDAVDIHPKDKQTVGHRLALQALKVTYGKDVAASGPVYDSMQVDGNKARLKFRNADGGLVAKHGVPVGFQIAGEDHKWYWAHAEIEGDSVSVWNAQVAKPVAVRYAWADNPMCNLYNGADLPAVPFRTDDWPGATKDQK
jgi:sialate O-acetylesterase